MYLKKIELAGFKSFVKKDVLTFTSPISAIVGPNGSGKSNVAEAFRFVLGEQSMKSMRGRRGEDLIFNGSPSVPRSNRASVKVFFDNSKRFLDIDYDEVIIERVVHRDGVNQYSINGSQVRLKDIVELLAHANIGSSGHHIISQGESDRILNANSRERREMIEDALGLKVFQYKKQESERKFSKTEENIAQVMSLRKEISPHLTFLEKQVKKFEKAFAMRDEVKVLYNEYLKRESEYLKYQQSRIEHEKKEPTEKLERLTGELAKVKKILSEGGSGDKKSQEVVKIEEDLAAVRKDMDTNSRELGRIEGELASGERRRTFEMKRKEQQGEVKTVPLKEVEELVNSVWSNIRKAQKEEDISKIQSVLSSVIDILKQFLSTKRIIESGEDSTYEHERKALSKTKEELEDNVESLTKKEDKLTKAYESLRSEIEAVKDESRQAEREMFRIMSAQSEFRGKLNMVKALEEKVFVERENFEREVAEAGVLVGKATLDFLDYHVVDKDGNKLDRTSIVKEPRSIQDERRRAIEKIKIRLEDVGGGTGVEIMAEFKEVKERDDFLGRELGDMEASAKSLKELISELEEKLDVRFKEGIDKINIVFQDFFSILFDGGSASLSVVKESRRARPAEEAEMGEEIQEESYEGIEVQVNLPHKRIKGLEMLSGGERALTSIALLFAMSQVNPPPFIILDETDAALDEANSRKYGDMIENLSKSSQLILITHNRETMSRAGVLYGITMGGDGVSKLLSVKLDEAVVAAK